MQKTLPAIVGKISREQILADYRTANESRQASLLGRKEVFSGKAKFGIFGDGKELPQLAMARYFSNGDFRSGYYRDQTFMFAAGMLNMQQYFAQLYAHPDIEHDPASGGRLMNGHFGTRMLDSHGKFLPQTAMKNSSSDVSPTGSQMPRLLGLAYSSKLYRNLPELHHLTDFSDKGNEVAFGTIGNASTSEGMFYETINAAGVLQVPMLISVWDDEYGISVPKEFHTTKGSISEVLEGFRRTEQKSGFEILKVKAWDYEALMNTYEQAVKICREEHTPVLVHVIECTQPQGHSTSGSHERYKSEDRLKWETEFDCIKKMREWMLEEGIADEEELNAIEKEATEAAKMARANAWNAFMNSIKPHRDELVQLIEVAASATVKDKLSAMAAELKGLTTPIYADCHKYAKKALRLLAGNKSVEKFSIVAWLDKHQSIAHQRYDAYQYSESEQAVSKIATVDIQYSGEPQYLDGREIIKNFFEIAFARDPRIFTLGEDVGKIGDVNQGMAGMQDKFGALRVSDTGIRECTIVGQGIGAALRGLKPIAEIQYLDYLNYALQILSDDVACLQYRTAGGQKAPLIIRTRGHRLEGIWHSGSPIGMIINSIRGMHLVVPRDFTRAAGFYNTLLESDEPAIVIECLNGYRLKEQVPANLGEYKLPLGLPEIIREGGDVTVVTYGSMCRVVLEAAAMLSEIGIEIEVIDVQTLLPFDVHHSIVKSIKKTGNVIFTDEDVPGGASAYMMQKVVEEQGAFRYLDGAPHTLSAKEHRPAYSSDGDYFSKPSADDVFDKVYAIMNEQDPSSYPALT